MFTRQDFVFVFLGVVLATLFALATRPASEREVIRKAVREGMERELSRVAR